jgi:hypothetical protein
MSRDQLEIVQQVSWLLLWRCVLERIPPLTFEHSPRGERSFCILVG